MLDHRTPPTRCRIKDKNNNKIYFVLRCLFLIEVRKAFNFLPRTLIRLWRSIYKDLSLIDPIQQEVIKFSQSMNWKYRLANKDMSKPFNARLVHGNKGAKIKGHIPLRGISVDSDPDNETLSLLFNPEGKLTSFLREIYIRERSIPPDQDWLFVKTQFGTVDAHIAIVKLLQYLKQSYIPNLDVNDDGEYWETADRERLIARRGYLFGMMTQVEKALTSANFDNVTTREELIQRIKKVIRNMNKKSDKT